MPLLIAISSLAGCYLSHERDAPDASAPDDAAVPTDARLDAPPDAGPIECALAPRAAIQASSTAFAAHAPRIGWDGERVGLVVFESDGSIPHPVVSATRVAADLSATAPLWLAGEESHSWGEAAWDPRVGLGVCWNGDPAGPSRTLFRIRDREGRELTPRVDVDAEGGACEGVARAGDRWGLVLRHGREQVAMRAVVIDDRGAIVGQVDLDDPTEYPGRGALIAADREGFVAAHALAGEGVVVTRIGRDGSRASRAIVPAPLARYAALAVHDDGTIGLAIRDGTRTEGGLRFVRLTRDLAVIPGETTLVELGRGARHPRVVAMPDGWAVLWVEQEADSRPATGAVLAHLDREGVPREPRRVLVAGANSAYGGPSLLAHEGGLYVAISRPPEGGAGSEQAFVSRLDCVAPAPDRCAPQDARSSGDACAMLDGYAWDGGGCAPVVCGCLGTECDRIAVTEAECLADHSGC